MSKLCMNCRNFVPSIQNVEEGVCLAFKKLSLITGNMQHIIAMNVRQNEKLCGAKARKYKEKHDSYNLIED